MKEKIKDKLYQYQMQGEQVRNRFKGKKLIALYVLVAITYTLLAIIISYIIWYSWGYFT